MPRPSATHPSDRVLARRAVGGCIDSFASLVFRHQVGVAHYARQVLGSDADVDDVVQEVFLRAHGRLAEYDSRWAFSTWLFTIARRCCLNHARSERRRRRRDTAAVRPEQMPAEGDPLAVIMAVESGASLWAAARVVLTERQFTAIWLRYVEGLAVEEVAAVIGCPGGTAKTVLFRARVRLASVLPEGRRMEGVR